MVTTVSLLRKESGRLLEDQEEVIRISQESASDIPEERNKMRGGELGRIKDTPEIRSNMEKSKYQSSYERYTRKCVGRKM